MEHIRKLKYGFKYTLAGFTLAGEPYYTRFNLLKMRAESFEQYADSYVLTCKARISSLTYIRLNAGKQFVIWEGEFTPNVDRVISRGTRDYEGGAVAVGQVWGLNDPRYMIRAKQSIHALPVCENIFPIVKQDHGDLFSVHQVLS